MSNADTTTEAPIQLWWTRGYDVSLRRCCVAVESGPDAGKRFGPLDEVTTIGREFSDVPLTDTSVSKQHCELAWMKAGLKLRDLGSTNGVLCNGIRVLEAVIGPDTRFRIGATTLRVQFDRVSSSRSSKPET